MSDEAATRAAADTAETNARIAGDAATLSSANTYTDTKVSDEAATRAAADTAETNARIAADTALQTGLNNVQTATAASLGVATTANDLATQANIAAQAGKGMAATALDMGVQNSIDISTMQSNLLSAASRLDSAESLLGTSVPFDVDGGISLHTDENGMPTGGIHHVADAVSRYDAVNLGQMQAGDAVTLSSANSYTDKSVAQGVAASLAMPSVGIEPGKTKGAGLAVGHYGGKTAVGAGFATKLGIGRLDLGLSGVQGGKAATKVAYSWSW